MLVIMLNVFNKLKPQLLLSYFSVQSSFCFMTNTLNILWVVAITWYKDGRPLTSAAGVTLRKRGQVLEIERAQLSDAGIYRCVAVNLAGAAEISHRLQVFGGWLFLYEAEVYPLNTASMSQRLVTEKP